MCMCIPFVHSCETPIFPELVKIIIVHIFLAFKSGVSQLWKCSWLLIANMYFGMKFYFHSL